jgi:Putative adhesin
MRKTFRKKRWIWACMSVLLIYITPPNIQAQGTLQVVTKSFEKTFDKTNNLKIEAEKADVELTVGSGNQIKISMELSAKHPNRKQAQDDLEMMKYVAEKFGSTIILRNYVQTENAKIKPASNLKARFVISIPEQMVVSVQNSFGKMNISGRFKELTLKADFCNTELKNVSGKIKIDAHYGEVNGLNLMGKTEVKSDRTDLNFSKLGLECTIDAKYAKVFIHALDNLQKLKIDAQKSEINLDGISIKNHHFNIVSMYGKLNIPASFHTSNADNRQTATLNEHLASTIDINNSFGTILIEN